MPMKSVVKTPMLLGLAFALHLFLSQTLLASHIFSTNIQINGTPVALGNAFTNPLIVVYANDPITFSFDLFSTDGDSDGFNVAFADAGGSTLPVPANDFFAYDGTGTPGTPVVHTFVRSFATAGIFNGTLVPDLTSSFPDYLFPGGAEASEPVIPFRIQVLDAQAVPEPASLALWTLGAMGAGIVGWRKRRRHTIALPNG